MRSACIAAGAVISPRKVRPDAPRDLETICLTCLATEPSARYATAEELARDLGRFLRWEPIRAVPEGWLDRSLRRARRSSLVFAVLAGLPIAAVAERAWRSGRERAASKARQREPVEASLREQGQRGKAVIGAALA